MRKCCIYEPVRPHLQAPYLHAAERHRGGGKAQPRAAGHCDRGFAGDSFHPHYYGIYQEIPVSDEMYEEWRALQNETQRVHRKEVYHRDWTPMEDVEEMPEHFAANELEDALIWDEQVAALYAAISQLTPIQQRRIRMLMDNLSIREIARQEGCHMNAALKSVNDALKKLRSLLKDW